MTSREKILAAIAQNQPEHSALPDISDFKTPAPGSPEKFEAMLTTVGGRLYHVNSYEEIAGLLFTAHGDKRTITTIAQLKTFYNEDGFELSNALELHNVEVAIIKAHFGVAENGAVWVTASVMGHRALPFICQHLAVVIDALNVVPTMHEAYELIGKNHYDYGTFIAGPSKTADIEQSLVIGAHGPRSMTVFVMNKV